VTIASTATSVPCGTDPDNLQREGDTDPNHRVAPAEEPVSNCRRTTRKLRHQRNGVTTTSISPKNRWRLGAERGLGHGSPRRYAIA
jgi:hypothetical protein